MSDGQSCPQCRRSFRRCECGREQDTERGAGANMCFDYDDAEAPQFASVAIVKCRKPCKCQECGGDINAGELAEYQSGLFDGEFYHDHYCGACEATRKAIADKETTEGCSGIEIWCPKGGLADYCHDTGFVRATVNDGQRYLAQVRERYRAKKKTSHQEQ